MTKRDDEILTATTVISEKFFAMMKEVEASKVGFDFAVVCLSYHLGVAVGATNKEPEAFKYWQIRCIDAFKSGMKQYEK